MGLDSGLSAYLWRWVRKSVVSIRWTHLDPLARSRTWRSPSGRAIQCSLSFWGRDFSKSRAAIRSRLTAFEEGSITLEGPFMETPVVSTRLHNNIAPNNTQPIASPSPQTVTAVWLNGLTGPVEQISENYTTDKSEKIPHRKPDMSIFRGLNQTKRLCKTGRSSILWKYWRLTKRCSRITHLGKHAYQDCNELLAFEVHQWWHSCWGSSGTLLKFAGIPRRPSCSHQDDWNHKRFSINCWTHPLELALAYHHRHKRGDSNKPLQTHTVETDHLFAYLQQKQGP